jgi:hypothetical protein
MSLEVEVTLTIAGLGIILYSPVFAEHISEGEDYFSAHYSDERSIQEHIQKGTIVGFGTGSPGTYTLRFRAGYPEEEVLQKCDYKYRLGLTVSGGVIRVRDVYDLMQWTPDCPSSQQLYLDDGYYHVTLSSNRPASGILGDSQVIDVHLQKLDRFPDLLKVGIPSLVLSDNA